MKDVVKTAILVVAILLVMVIIFLVVGNLRYSVEKLNRSELIESEPTVTLLFDRVKNKTTNRRANLRNEEMSTLDIVKYVLDNLTEDEKTIKKYKANKIVCEISTNISFTTSTSNCDVLILNKDKIMEYQKKYFGIEKTLEHEDFQYKGYTCKNSTDNYYCLISNFTDYTYGYSLFDAAYQEKEKVVISEYYLQINVTDNDRCIEYFDENYCLNYKEMERPYLDQDIIKKNGVLYEHVFKETEDNYYLENSFIVSER